MARTRAASAPRPSRRTRAAESIEARENQLISYAVDLAEQQLLDGTASSQVITHFLKLGTTRAELEKERLIYENQMIQAKTENLKSIKRSEELMEKALKAFRSYNGQGEPDDDY